MEQFKKKAVIIAFTENEPRRTFKSFTDKDRLPPVLYLTVTEDPRTGVNIIEVKRDVDVVIGAPRQIRLYSGMSDVTALWLAQYFAELLGEYAWEDVKRMMDIRVRKLSEYMLTIKRLWKSDLNWPFLLKCIGFSKFTIGGSNGTHYEEFLKGMFEVCVIAAERRDMKLGYYKGVYDDLHHMLVTWARRHNNLVKSSFMAKTRARKVYDLIQYGLWKDRGRLRGFPVKPVYPVQDSFLFPASLLTPVPVYAAASAVTVQGSDRRMPGPRRPRTKKTVKKPSGSDESNDPEGESGSKTDDLRERFRKEVDRLVAVQDPLPGMEDLPVPEPKPVKEEKQTKKAKAKRKPKPKPLNPLAAI